MKTAPVTVAYFKDAPVLRRGDADMFHARWNGYMDKHGNEEAAYLAKAANAYPKLIAMVREIAEGRDVEMCDARSILSDLGEWKKK